MMQDNVSIPFALIQSFNISNPIKDINFLLPYRWDDIDLEPFCASKDCLCKVLLSEP